MFMDSHGSITHSSIFLFRLCLCVWLPLSSEREKVRSFRSNTSWLAHLPPTTSDRRKPDRSRSLLLPSRRDHLNKLGFDVIYYLPITVRARWLLLASLASRRLGPRHVARVQLQSIASRRFFGTILRVRFFTCEYVYSVRELGRGDGMFSDLSLLQRARVILLKERTICCDEYAMRCPTGSYVYSEVIVLVSWRSRMGCDRADRFGKRSTGDSMNDIALTR